MTRDELNKTLCAVITTLDEVEYSPESSLYLGLGMDMDKWNLIKQILIAGNLATIEYHRVTIAPAGKVLAARINSFIAREDIKN